MNLPRKKIAATLIVSIGALFIAANPSQAMPAVSSLQPTDFSYSTESSDPQSIGMGGVYLLTISGAQGDFYNPANAGKSKRVQADIDISATTANINVDNISGYSDDLKNLNNDTKSNSNTNYSQFSNDINNVWNDAKNLESGGTIKARAIPLVGLSLGGPFTIVGASDIQANARVQTSIAPPSSGNAGVSVQGGALAITSVGVPLAIEKNKIRYGIMPKYVRADYEGYGYSATENQQTQTVSSNTVNEDEKNIGAFDLDAGITAPFARGLATGAAVIRHIVSPKFDISGYNSFSLKPEVDLGAAAKLKIFTGAIEVHNLTNSNGSGDSLHVGASADIFHFASLRTGFDNGALVYGFGVNSGLFTLNAASGTNITKRASVSLGINAPF
jgi:hypothetical protein